MALPYDISYSDSATRNLVGIRVYYRGAIIDAIELHLGFTPTQESRTTIKKMSQPYWAQYRLRVGTFRVYYDVDEARRLVQIHRVLEKGTEATPEVPPP